MIRPYLFILDTINVSVPDGLFQDSLDYDFKKKVTRMWEPRAKEINPFQGKKYLLNDSPYIK